MKLNLLMILLSVILGSSTFYIKNKVTTLNKQLIDIKSYKTKDIKDLQLLKAELIYLSSPTKIAVLNNKYLNLSLLTVAQLNFTNTHTIITSHDIFNIKQNKVILNPKNNKEIALAKNAPMPKWNYKHTNFQAFLGK